MGWVNTQREQFQRLGVLADWDNPLPHIGTRVRSRRDSSSCKNTSKWAALPRRKAGQLVPHSTNSPCRSRGGVPRSHKPPRYM